VKIRGGVELRRLFDATVTETGDPIKALFAVYDAGRMDAQSRDRRRRNPLKLRRRPTEDVRARATALLEAVAKNYRLAVKELTCRFPVKSQRDALCEAQWLLRTVLDLSYPDIAYCTKKTCHTSAMDGVAKVEARIAVRPELRDELLAIVHGAPERRLRSVG
jgi:hypothetical protein